MDYITGLAMVIGIVAGILTIIWFFSEKVRPRLKEVPQRIEKKGMKKNELKKVRLLSKSDVPYELDIPYELWIKRGRSSPYEAALLALLLPLAHWNVGRTWNGLGLLVTVLLSIFFLYTVLLELFLTFLAVLAIMLYTAYDVYITASRHQEKYSDEINKGRKEIPPPEGIYRYTDKKIIAVLLLSLIFIWACMPPESETLIEPEYYIYDSEFLACFAHLDPTALPFVNVTVDNTAGSAFNARMSISVGEYATPYTWSGKIEEYTVSTIPLSPTFNINKLENIKSPVFTTAELKVENLDTSKVIYQKCESIKLLPLNYYYWGDITDPDFDFRPYVVVLSTPNADVIQDILSEAAKKTQWGIIGYQSVPGYSEKEIVELQMKAIYETINESGIKYVSTPVTFTSLDFQNIKFPSQVVKTKSGNCIETSLLLTACFEKVGFDTDLIFTNNHVLVVVEKWSDSIEAIPLETTMIGYGSYEDARREGDKNLNEMVSNIYYLEVPVYEYRGDGFDPVPLS